MAVTRILPAGVGRTAEVRVSCSPVHSVAPSTGTSRALSRVGRNVTSATFDIANPSRRAWTDTDAFRVVAIDAAGRRAWTNPIWIDEPASG